MTNQIKVKQSEAKLARIQAMPSRRAERRQETSDVERWLEIPDFYGYSVSNHGRVRNDFSGRIMALVRNQGGTIHVGLVRNRKQYKRSLAKLVAEAFLPRNTLDHFRTPIHLDGNPENNHYHNLAWRPRQFADAYHRQFNRWPLIGRPIRDVDTGERYSDSHEACKKHGLLDKDILKSVIEGFAVHPTFQIFEITE